MNPPASRLLIIDGLNLLRRLFAVQQGQTDDPTALQLSMQQAVKSSVRDLFKRLTPSHAVAVFDSERQGWRYRCFPDYKRSRKPMPDSLREMLDDLQETLLQLGIDSLLSDDEEADDLIAALAVKSSPHLEVIVASTDHGFYQLQRSANIRQWHPFTKQFLDRDYYRDKYQIAPQQWCDYQALVGDTTNDIPGAPGIGKKTAAKLLAEHPGLQQLFDHPQLPQKLAATLSEHKQQLTLARQLATLRSEIPLGFSLKDLRIRRE